MNKGCLKKALDIAKNSDNPIVAIVVYKNEVVGIGINSREDDNDITSHAEILAIKSVSKEKKNWRLEDCEIFVTLEPCPMCAWAILQARLKAVYFGAFNPQYGAFGSSVNLCDISPFKPKVYGGIMEDECSKLLQDFWTKKRGE